MKAMSEYNSYMSANNSWGLPSDYPRGRNLADISGAYKNFLENDIDFNEQHDYAFKMQQRDIFSSDLSYEPSELMLPNTGLISHGLGLTNGSENALKLLQLNGSRLNQPEENFIKYPSTGDDTRMEEDEDFQRVPSKRIIDDFDRSDFGIGWSNDKSQHAKASYQLSQGISHREFYDDNDDDIHNMLATDSSLTATPLTHKASGGPSRKFICEPDDEIYSHNSTLKLLRSTFEPKWPEFQLETVPFTMPHHDIPQLHDSTTARAANQIKLPSNLLSKSTQAQIFFSQTLIFQAQITKQIKASLNQQLQVT